MKKSNVLSTDPANPGFSKPVGSADSKGVEFDVNAKLPAGFELFLTYAYTDAGWATNVFDPNFGLPILKGDPLINIPKLSADVNNLFDKKYYASSYAALWIQPGMPRSFTIRGTFNF